MLTANAAAAPRLSSASRVRAELEPSSSSDTSATGIPPFTTSLSPERTACKAFDEAVEEGVVEEREHDARDQGRRHERLPEEDVSANELVGDARRDRPVLRGGDERERVDELVDAEREREDDDGQDAGKRDREDDPRERLDPRAAVDQGGVLELLRDRLEEPHQEPGRERDSEGRVHQDQREQRVLEAEPRDEGGEGQEQQGRRDQVDEEDADSRRLTPTPREARERVAGRERDHERDDDDHRAHDRRVDEPVGIPRVRKEELDVLRGRRLPELPLDGVVDVGDVLRVVEVEVLLEHRHEHPVEGEREQDREGAAHQRGPEAGALGSRPASHYDTGARLGKKGIARLTAASSGKR